MLENHSIRSAIFGRSQTAGRHEQAPGFLALRAAEVLKRKIGTTGLTIVKQTNH